MASTTEWMEVCRVLDENYRLGELKIIASRVLQQPTSRLRKRELCERLARHYSGLKRYRHNSGCRNPTIGLDDFDDYHPSLYVKDEGRFCFLHEELRDLLRNRTPHPYTRQPLDQVRVAGKDYTLLDAAYLPGESFDHREYTRDGPSQLSNRIEQIYNELKVRESRDRTASGDYIYKTDSVRFNDVELDEVANIDIERVKNAIRGTRLVMERELDKYLKRGGSRSNFYNNLHKLLIDARVHHFNDLHHVKNIIINAVHEHALAPAVVDDADYDWELDPEGRVEYWEYMAEAHGG